MSAVPRNTVLQPKLNKNQSIKIIGLGGVGSIVARYGLLFLASLHTKARAVLIDGDEFEPKNATRMIFGDFGNKADVVRNELNPRFEHSELTVHSAPEYITPENEKNLIRDGDIVICCVDNHATRKLIQNRVNKLKNCVLISGGNDGVGPDSTGKVARGTYGNVQIHIRKNGKDITPPLTYLHPEIDKPADKLPTERSCTEMVLSVPQILNANLATASSILNALWLHLSGELRYSEACFDIADSIARITLPAPALIEEADKRNAAKEKKEKTFNPKVAKISQNKGKGKAKQIKVAQSSKLKLVKVKPKSKARAR